MKEILLMILKSFCLVFLPLLGTRLFFFVLRITDIGPLIIDTFSKDLYDSIIIGYILAGSGYLISLFLLIYIYKNFSVVRKQ